MSFKKLLKYPAIGLITLFSIQAQAAIVGWGTASFSTVATNCPSGSLCSTQNNGQFIRDSEVNPNVTSASSEVDIPEGLTSGNATLDGGNFTPLLTGYALSKSVGGFPDNSGAFSTSIGAQGYTYSGPAQNLEIDLTLSAILDENGAADSLARAQARVVVFTGPDVDKVPFFTDLGTYLFEELPGTTPALDVSFIQSPILSVNVNSTRLLLRDTETLVIEDVVPGQEFLVWASLSTNAYREGEADARNTFTLEFFNETPPGTLPGDRVPLSANSLGAISVASPNPVPLPAGAWLFLTGIGAIYGFSRRRKIGKAV